MAWKAHPNLIEVIQKEQAASEVTIEQLSGAGRVRAKNRKVVRHKAGDHQEIDGRVHWRHQNIRIIFI